MSKTKAITEKKIYKSSEVLKREKMKSSNDEQSTLSSYVEEALYQSLPLILSRDNCQKTY